MPSQEKSAFSHIIRVSVIHIYARRPERNVTNHPTKLTLEMMELKSISRVVKKSKDLFAAELLKNGGFQLVIALQEMIQLGWTSETLPNQYIKK
jgi:hypothetical protein